MKISQKALIKKGEKYLILLRSDYSPVFPNHWDFPGGKLDEGEILEEGIIREVKEETSLDIDVGKIIFEYYMQVGSVSKFNIYEVKTYIGKIKLSHEHKEFKWATKEEILELKIFPYIKPFLERV